MKPIRIPFTRASFTVLATLACISSSHIALAQHSAPPPSWQAKPITVEVKQQSFPDILAMLSKQIGRSIVADDVPDVKQASFKVEGSTKQALDKVAAAFDYSWTLNRQGILVMSKAFQKTTSLPQMNLPEMRQMARTAVDILSLLHCDPSPFIWGDQCQILATSFTPEQSQALQRGKTLHIQDFSGEQSAVLQKIVLNHAFGDVTSAWNDLANLLEAMPASQVELLTLNQGQSRRLDYVRQSKENPLIRHPLSILPPEKKQP